MKVTFYGGAQTVTGANYLIEAAGMRMLVDCGMFQGSRYNEDLNLDPFPYDAADVDCLFVTHSHADHIGRIPKLYRDGFRGVVYASEPTAAIAAAALPDTLDKVVSEAKENGRPPMWDREDMEKVIGLFHGVPFRKRILLSENVTAELYRSSHILGSSIVVFSVQEDGRTKRIAFSGDMGNPPTVLLEPIDYPENLSWTTVESAYGNRFHEDREERSQKLLSAIEGAIAHGGVVLIPSFAVERTQELLLELDRWFDQGRLPKVPFFVDSPLAIDITKVYGKFSTYFNEEARRILRDNNGMFQFPWLHFTPTVAESKRINDISGPKVIIAGSGMSQGGRIVHHEARYLSDPKNAIIFIGFQVAGSLGRRIMDGEPEVPILGKRVPVRAKISVIGAYSAHADQNGLVEYVRQCNRSGTLQEVFVVQGEPEAAGALAERIRADLGIRATVPSPSHVQEF